MWKEIRNKDDAKEFMDMIGYFHDSCVKEMYYYSGAYVKDNLSMHPVNSQRALRIVIQRQYEEVSMIELEFQGLKIMTLCPPDDYYTCEILDATLEYGENGIFWCDHGNVSVNDPKICNGTRVLASGLRWRVIDGHMGEAEFYKPIVE